MFPLTRATHVGPFFGATAMCVYFSPVGFKGESITTGHMSIFSGLVFPSHLAPWPTGGDPPQAPPSEPSAGSKGGAGAAAAATSTPAKPKARRQVDRGA